jgi:hypothetical protein
MAIFYFSQNKAIIVYASQSENIKISAEVLGLTEAGILKDFSTDKKLFEFADVNFKVIFQNTGNTNLTTSGYINVVNFLQKNVAQINVNPEKITTYIGQSIEFNPQWKRASYLGFGKYSAYLNLQYGQGYTISSQLSFWVFPIRMIAALILIIILIMNIPSFVPSYYSNDLLVLKVRDGVINQQSKQK